MFKARLIVHNYTKYDNIQHMHGPYSAQYVGGEKVIRYLGNKVFSSVDDVKKTVFSKEILDNRVKDISENDHFFHLHNIDNGIFFSAVEYFKNIHADWCNLPLTTLMISSPGEIYAGKKLDYTTDTLPIDISWFDSKRNVFLSESSQFYLELRLLVKKIDRVFSVYNSFRKERADYCHLSEFQHIEFEGKVSLNENIDIALGLLENIVNYLLENNRTDLSYFLTEPEVFNLANIFKKENFKTLKFKDAMELLYNDTKNDDYKEFSMKFFGSWEEIRLTEIVGCHVIVTEFPILQIPFYHNVLSDEEGVQVAENADIILYGFRETVGSGVRISDKDILLRKAKVFNLPEEDYEPYLMTRDFDHYQKTAGFGLGWQRLVHWLLKLPYIWDSTHVPRGHHLPKP